MGILIGFYMNLILLDISVRSTVFLVFRISKNHAENIITANNLSHIFREHQVLTAHVVLEIPLLMGSKVSEEPLVQKILISHWTSNFQKYRSDKAL